MDGYQFEKNEDVLIRYGEEKIFQVLPDGDQKDFYRFMLTNKFITWTIDEGNIFKSKFREFCYPLSDIKIKDYGPDISIEDDEYFGKALRIRFKENELFLGTYEEDTLDEIHDEIIECLDNVNNSGPKLTKQFCPQCGYKLAAGANFCSNCGYKID